MNSNRNLEAALDYARRGLKVFPLFYVKKSGACSCGNPKCKRIGKHPATANGVQDASSDEAIVTRWWSENPFANIGLATGHGGVIVMDVDEGVKKDGTKKVGPASLETMRAGRELPETLMVKTGSGGKHYYFLTEREFKNSASKVAPDIDFRTYGGYVILPPSNHESGGKYEWLNDSKIADLPSWIAEKLAGQGKIDFEADHDPKQQALIQASLKEDRINGEKLIRLLHMSGPDGGRFLPPDCDRDTWWQIGAALKHELGDKKGWEVWKEWSAEYDHPKQGWDEKTGLTQWASFNPDRKGSNGRAITGATIIHFAKQNGFRGFDKEAADLPDIRDKWLYVASIKRFVETTNLTEWDKDQFDAMFSPMFERGSPASHVLRNEMFERVASCTYWPNQPRRVDETDGRSCLNYWRPSPIAPSPGSVKPFLDHVDYLYPNGEESAILLDYLAFQVQYPGEKVHWALLLEGEPGTGKSYFSTVMRRVLGDHNVSMVHPDTLHETFTGWQRNTQLVVVEEMMARNRLEVMNKLKPMITEDWCTIREMYRPPYQQPNRFNFLFFSNHNNALILDAGDRRYCVLKSPLPIHPEKNAYYGPLFDWTRKNVPAIAHYLGKERKLDKFLSLAKAHAPMTAGKREMIRQSMLPIDQFIHDQVEAQEYPCRWDLMQPGLLVRPLAKFGIKANPKDVTNSFSRLGYLYLGKRRTGGDTKVHMWAVRSFDTYREMKAGQLQAVWLAQVQNHPMEADEKAMDELAKFEKANPLEEQEPM